ncbi:metallophosphoesterase [Bacillus sp. USDA818B3_A]|uniref:metallophosphoesterase n=1 Tax=Bacillus sp. USDA818B3_A TaxID=2698834 RepID=UPI001371E516|nr:metallophosphoesterase [Bacillus sp. USDA818B3_A]
MWFIIGVVLIYNLLLFYIGWNGWKWIKSIWGEKRPVFKYVYWLVLLFFAYSFMLGRLFNEDFFITWIGAIWLGLFYFLLLLLPFVNLTVFLIKKYTTLSKTAVTKNTGIVTLTVVAGLFSYGIFNAYSPVVRNYAINIPKQVKDKQTITIAMASDMHFGMLSGDKQAKKLVDKINSMNPDLVIFPGDIIDDDVQPFLDEGIPDILKQINAPVYASLGNHDRDDEVDLYKILNESGMRLLADEVVELENGVTLIGRKDRGYQDVVRAKLPELLKQVDASKPLLLLEHQPYDLDIAKNYGIDLMLSGHTHRGQIAPMNFITDKIYENDWGYLKKGTLQSIVSSGYGLWGTPIRLGSRSEILKITVTFNK